MFFVRSASSRDIPALVSLLADSWRATYDTLYGVEKVTQLIAEWHSPEAIARNLARPDGEYLVADDGKELGGMAFASMSGSDDVKSIKLHQLYVRPGFHRMGIGRDLFADIETCFPDAKRLLLEVDPDNAQAIAFYRGVGMDVTSQTQNCGGGDSGIPALIMEKPLGI